LKTFIESGKRFYGIEDGGRTMELVKEEWMIEESMELGEERVKPLRAGEMVKWKIVR
jgi:dihydroorotase